MYTSLIRALKLLLAVIVAAAMFDIGLSSALDYFDTQTKKALLWVTAQELPPHASIREIDEFMRRHAARYAFDDRYQHE